MNNSQSRLGRRATTPLAPPTRAVSGKNRKSSDSTNPQARFSDASSSVTLGSTPKRKLDLGSENGFDSQDETIDREPMSPDNQQRFESGQPSSGSPSTLLSGKVNSESGSRSPLVDQDQASDNPNERSPSVLVHARKKRRSMAGNHSYLDAIQASYNLRENLGEGNRERKMLKSKVKLLKSKLAESEKKNLNQHPGVENHPQSFSGGSPSLNLNSSRRSRDQTMHKTVDHVVPMKKEDRFDTIKRWQEENENEKAESATKIKDLEARNEVLQRELYEESRLVSSLEKEVDGLEKKNLTLEKEKSKGTRKREKVEEFWGRFLKSAEKDYLGLFDEDDDTDEEDQADADVDEGWQDALDSQGREENLVEQAPTSSTIREDSYTT